MGVAEKLSEKKYTLEEYLEMEEKADFKSEFWNGRILAMAGGTPNHAKITNSIGTAIDNELNKLNKDCSVYSSDVKVFLPNSEKIVYPDCMVLCGDEEYKEESKNIITNASLIIEVLSKSTKEYDKTTKFDSYRSMLSFKEYVLVWQTIPKVQSWYKEEENLWRISNAFGLDQSIPLYSLGCEIILSDIYKRVKELGEEELLDSY